MKYALVIALGLSVAGCESLSALTGSVRNPVTRSDFAVAEASYGAVLVGARGYKAACAAKEIPRTCRAIVVKLRYAEDKAYKAIVRARTFIINNPQINASSIFTAAKDAIADFRLIATNNGVK